MKPQQAKQVGFQVGTKQVLTGTKKPNESGLNSDFQAVPNDIISAIKSGTKDPRLLMKRYKLNVVQVNQYLKEYLKIYNLKILKL